MFSEQHGLPEWELYLIERFDLEHVAVERRDGSKAMLYDPEVDVGLAVAFSDRGVQLQLGGAFWGGLETGSIKTRPVQAATSEDLSNGVLERITTTHRRQMNVLRDVFDSYHADLLEAWTATFGHRHYPHFPDHELSQHC